MDNRKGFRYVSKSPASTEMKRSDFPELSSTEQRDVKHTKTENSAWNKNEEAKAKEATTKEPEPTTKSSMKICFCSDLHGSLNHYKAMIRVAEANQCNWLLIGGDLHPKTQGEMSKDKSKAPRTKKSVLDQREFFERSVIPLLMKTQIPSILIMGNADLKGNMDFYKKISQACNFHFRFLESSESFMLSDMFRVVGYSYIPIGQKPLKDWEKWDENGYYDAVVEGSMSSTKATDIQHYKKVYTKDQLTTDTMETDMKNIFKSLQNKEKLICMFHCPPYGTNLDMLHNKLHVGSKAIAKAITDNSKHIAISLHGHIHESVDSNGKRQYIDRMGDTFAVSSGNRFNKDVVSCIVFDPTNPGSAIRIQESIHNADVTAAPTPTAKPLPVLANNAPNSESKHKILCCGLGGGLDIVNASLLYFAAKNENVNVALGSTRPVGHTEIEGHTRFADNGTLLDGKSKILQKGRYIEPRISTVLNEPIVFFSRQFKGKVDKKRLGQAINDAQQKFGFTDIFFIDGGGDSLTLQASDIIKESQDSSPFDGGDAELLAAIHATKLNVNVYQAVIAVGLDIDEEAFQANVQMLEERGGYFGRVNLHTGEKDKYKLDHIIQFKPGFLDEYFKLTDRVLAYDAKDLKSKDKMISHTGTVTFHALMGNFGLQRTFVPWEPVKDGVKGVIVKPEHSWMYFFDARAVEQLKIELNMIY